MTDRALTLPHDVYAAAGGAHATLADYVTEAEQWALAHAADEAGMQIVGRWLLTLWHQSTRPEEDGGREAWIRALRAIGFTSDRDPSRPSRSLVVWRGATPERRLGMAWTTHRTVAEEHAFENTLGFREPGKELWRAVAPLGAVLAMIGDRGEDEVLVDSAMLLEIERAVPSEPAP